MSLCRRGLVAVAIAGSAAPLNAQAHAIDTPAGRLSRAVLILGRQSGLSIGIEGSAVGALQVRAVRGRMSGERALRQLISGLPVQVVRAGPGIFRIVPRPPRPRPPDPQPSSRQVVDERPEQQQEIVVTASKRDIRLSHFPGSVTIISGSELSLDGASGTQALVRRIPALGSTYFGAARDKLFVRGISDSSFAGQTQSTVGQYWGESRLNYNAPDPGLRLYDVESVELLAGPQGTLYGAGSMGGVLTVRPQRPVSRQTSASLLSSASVTSHGAPGREIAGTLNLPLGTGAQALRAVAYDVLEGGFIDDPARGANNVNRVRVSGGRLSAKLLDDADWSLLANGLVQSTRSEDSHYVERPAKALNRPPQSHEPYSSRYALGQVVLRGGRGGTRVTLALSRSGYQLAERFSVTNQATPGQYRRNLHSDLVSGEARLVHASEDGLGWLLGVHYARSVSSLVQSDEGTLPSADPPRIRSRLGEGTLFGEASGKVGSLRVSAGLRLSRLSTKATATSAEDAQVPVRMGMAQSSWIATPSAAVIWSPVQGVGIYLRHQQGFRPASLIVSERIAQEVRPDRLRAFEAGLRLGPRGPVSSASVAAVYTRWSNVQADMIDGGGAPSVIGIGDGRILSLDASIKLKPVSALEFEASGIINRDRLTSHAPGIIIMTDRHLPNVPRSAGLLRATYVDDHHRLGRVKVDAWLRYAGRSTPGIGPMLNRRQGGTVDTGVEAQLAMRRTTYFARVDNLFDEVGNRFALGSVFSANAEGHVTPMRPRTIQIGARINFP